MVKHRKFNLDRFLDKFQERESLIHSHVSKWGSRLNLSAETLDVPSFKDFLTNGDGEAMDELVESLCRAYDLCTERGHEDLLAACRASDYEPDPEGKLPVECLSLKVLTENEAAFNLAYDRNTMWKADRFTVYRGEPGRSISNLRAASPKLRQKLADVFQEDKSGDRVLVRHYEEDGYANFIVYHQKRTKAELVFKGTKTKPRVMPMILRPAQQDFISYNSATGQVEIEARFEREDAFLRRAFAECCLGRADFFEGTEAAKRLDLSRIADDDFKMDVAAGDAASLVELRFKLKQRYGPGFVIRSEDVLRTLELNGLRKKLSGPLIKAAVFKITFPDDARGKRVELSGTNRIKFKRTTHAEKVFEYLTKWEVLLA